METSENITKAMAQRLEAEQEYLNLLEKLLRRKDGPREKRRQVLDYCKANAVSESTIWRELSLFREAGAAGILFGKEPIWFFNIPDMELRERILSLIKKLPVQTLSDFRELTIFADQFRDRVQFICDLMLSIFLETEKGAWRDSTDTAQYTDFFIQKMFKELDFIHEIINLLTIERANTEYESWLSSKLLNGEVVA